LIKAAGRFSRPDRDELPVERETEKWLPNVKWKSEIEQPEGNRNCHAREVFHGAKTGFNDLALKEQQELETPRIATYVKRSLLKCTTFTILCVQIAVILIMPNGSKLPM
jgi:hypothetical protein